jgi:hypothetical protein
VIDLADATYRRVDYTDPQGMVCTACGPNGSNWHGWPWSKFTYGKLAASLGLRTLVQQQRFMEWACVEHADIYELCPDDIKEELRRRFDQGSFDLFLG